MYFDFGDGHPDLQRVPRALSTREEVLVAIIIHLLVIIMVLVAPHLPWVKAYRAAEKARLVAAEQLRQQRQQQQPFMFVQPRLDVPARRPPPQAPPSDIDRQAMTRFRPERPTNRQPAARGNTADFTEGAPRSRRCAPQDSRINMARSRRRPLKPRIRDRTRCAFRICPIEGPPLHGTGVR